MKRFEITSQFPDHRGADYYNTAGSALCPTEVRDQVKQYLDAVWTDIIDTYTRYNPLRERLRANLAALVGATVPELAITHHTAEGASLIAAGIDWRRGDKILTLDHEYPSTIYPWMNLEKRHGIQLILLEEREGRVDEDEIVAALFREKPRLFALSAVQWCTGYRFDLEKIGRACSELGTFFFVDTAQTKTESIG